MGHVTPCAPSSQPPSATGGQGTARPTQRGQPDINLALGSGPLSTEWRGDLLEGVRVIKGAWADGSPLLAIPNYARNNRNGGTGGGNVGTGAAGVDYSGGATVRTTGAGANAVPSSAGHKGNGSMVWMKDQ